MYPHYFLDTLMTSDGITFYFLLLQISPSPGIYTVHGILLTLARVLSHIFEVNRVYFENDRLSFLLGIQLFTSQTLQRFHSIPYSQLMRLKCICSKNEDFLLKSNELCNYFYNSGFPKNIIDHSRSHVIALLREQIHWPLLISL